MDAEILIYSDAGRSVLIKTPLSFHLTPDEAAEKIREFWAKTIVPIQDGLRSSQSYPEAQARLSL